MLTKHSIFFEIYILRGQVVTNWQHWEHWSELSVTTISTKGPLWKCGRDMNSSLSTTRSNNACWRLRVGSHRQAVSLYCSFFTPSRKWRCGKLCGFGIAFAIHILPTPNKHHNSLKPRYVCHTNGGGKRCTLFHSRAVINDNFATVAILGRLTCRVTT